MMSGAQVTWRTLLLSLGLLLVAFSVANTHGVELGQKRDVDYRIVVLTRNRPSSLLKLLHSLGQTFFDEKRVELQIRVDFANDDDEGYTETLEIVKDIMWHFGPYSYVLAEKTLGLAAAWFTAWSNPLQDQRIIIFEDDIIVSRFWFRWLRTAWEKYADVPGLAGISLQRQSLIPAIPHRTKTIMNGNSPFLFKLVGSIGFSPHPSVWSAFLKWLNEDPRRDYSISNLITSRWYQGGKQRTRMWTQPFIFFCKENSLYTLYVTPENGQTLAAHMRQKGVHFSRSVGQDFPVVNTSTVLSQFPDVLVRYDWDGSTLNSTAEPQVLGGMAGESQTSLRRHLLGNFGHAARRAEEEQAPGEKQPEVPAEKLDRPQTEKSSRVPVVFISWAPCDTGLAVAVKAAMHANEVVVLSSNAESCASILPIGVAAVDIKTFSKSATKFQSTILKTNTALNATVTAPFLRFFVLVEWMRRARVDEVLLVESNVLYYTNAVELSHTFSDFNVSLPIRSPHVSSSAVLLRAFVVRCIVTFVSDLFQRLRGPLLGKMAGRPITQERIMKLFLLKTASAHVLTCQALSDARACEEDLAVLRDIAMQTAPLALKIHVGNLAEPHQSPSGEWRVFGGPSFPYDPRFLLRKSAAGDDTPAPSTILRSARAFYWSRHIGHCQLEGIQFPAGPQRTMQVFERSLRQTKGVACSCTTDSCEACSKLDGAELVIASLWRTKHLPFLEPHTVFYSRFYFSHALLLVLELSDEVAWSTVDSRLNAAFGEPNREVPLDSPAGSVIAGVELKERLSSAGQQIWTLSFRRDASSSSGDSDTPSDAQLMAQLLAAVPEELGPVLHVQPDEFLKPPDLTALASRGSFRAEVFERVPTSNQFNALRPMMWRREETCLLKVGSMERKCTPLLDGQEGQEDYRMYVMTQNATRFSPKLMRQTLEDNEIRWVFKSYSQSNVVAEAKFISDRHGLVFLQLLTAGFVSMTKSWICNVRRIESRDNVSILARTLFVASDEKAYQGLREFDASLHVIYEPEPTSSALHYGHLQYFEYMMFRSELVFNMLKAGVTVWLVESDAVWLEDPTPYAATVAAADVVTMSDALPPSRGVQGGFLLLRPTETTKRMWEAMLGKLVVVIQELREAKLKSVGNQGSEQRLLQAYLSRTSEVHVHWLDANLFVSGLWYKDEGWQRAAPTPVVILNNWIAGNQNKIKRSREWGHWFLVGSEDRCIEQGRAPKPRKGQGASIVKEAEMETRFPMQAARLSSSTEASTTAAQAASTPALVASSDGAPKVASRRGGS